MPIIQTLQKVAHTSRQARLIDMPGWIQTMLTHLMEQQSTTNQPLKTVIRYSQRFLIKDKERSQESKHFFTFKNYSTTTYYLSQPLYWLITRKLQCQWWKWQICETLTYCHSPTRRNIWSRTKKCHEEVRNIVLLQIIYHSLCTDSLHVNYSISVESDKYVRLSSTATPQQEQEEIEENKYHNYRLEK